MHNVLFAPPSEAELVAALEATAGSAGVLPAHDDPVWSEVRARPLVASAFRAVCERAAAEATEAMPVLTDELYADFFRTGERLSFEKIYFERRRRVARAAMALLLDPLADRPRLVASLAAKLADLLDEPSWSLPAHVWTEPTGKNPLQIDLKVAETANCCAELATVFRDLLPADLIARTRNRLREQVFENYARRHAEIHWTKLPMNWNAVCHQGVIGAALTFEDNPALIARMLAPALRGLPVFLRGFGDDGTTSEGPNYWTYGFGWFCELNAQLERRSAGRWSLLEGDAHSARIARFAPLMSFAGGHLVNFSDGSREGRLPPGLLAYLGDRLGDPLLRAEAAASYAHLARTGVDPDAHSSEFFQLARLALRAPAEAPGGGAVEPERPDVFFPDYGAIIARGRDARGHRWEFAAKAGHNDEHHNHNDCGSFLLNFEAVPALFEIGAPEYTRSYFGDTRYTFLAARSLGHSVPFVNGVEQAAGREFSAEVRTARVGEDRVEFVVDLTRCYPAEAKCRSLMRTCVLEKAAGRLTVSDAYELTAPGEFESVLICREDVVLVGAEARLPGLNGPALRLVPATGWRWIEPEIGDYRDRFGAPHRVARLRLRALDGTSSARGMSSFTVLAE